MQYIGEYNSINQLLTACTENSIPEYVGLRPLQIEQANLTYELLKNKPKEEILKYRNENIQYKKNNLWDYIKYHIGFDDRRANKRATDRILNELDGKVIVPKKQNLEDITNDSLGMLGSSMVK